MDILNAIASTVGAAGVGLLWLACTGALLVAPFVLAAKRHPAAAIISALAAFAPLVVSLWAKAGTEPPEPDCDFFCWTPWMSFWLALILAVVPAGIVSAVTLAITLGSKRPTASQPIPRA